MVGDHWSTANAGLEPIKVPIIVTAPEDAHAAFVRIDEDEEVRRAAHALGTQHHIAFLGRLALGEPAIVIGLVPTIRVNILVTVNVALLGITIVLATIDVDQARLSTGVRRVLPRGDEPVTLSATIVDIGNEPALARRKLSAFEIAEQDDAAPAVFATKHVALGSKTVVIHTINRKETSVHGMKVSEVIVALHAAIDGIGDVPTVLAIGLGNKTSFLVGDIDTVEFGGIVLAAYDSAIVGGIGVVAGALLGIDEAALTMLPSAPIQ